VPNDRFSYYGRLPVGNGHAAAGFNAVFTVAAGALDALICCAGILRIGPMESMSVEDFDRVFAVNTRGTWLCVREALPLLRNRATPERPAHDTSVPAGSRSAIHSRQHTKRQPSHGCDFS